MNKQLELSKEREATLEKRAVDAEELVLSTERTGREKEILDGIAAKYPDASRSVIRGLYLGLIADRKVERYSRDEGEGD